MLANAYQEYKSNQISTANPKELILMLYDGAIRFLEVAAAGADDYKKYDEVNANILKGQDIITELMLSLDMEKGGEIASNLFNLYAFMKKELLEANIEKSATKVKNVIKLLSELRDAWKQVDVAAPVIQNDTPPADYQGFAAQG